MLKTTELEAELAALLRLEGKHALYQALPPCFAGGEPGLVPTGTPRLDDRRFEFLKEHLPRAVSPPRVVDIGANSGYFSFRLASEFGANVVAFEPHEPHAKAMGIIRAGCDLPEDRFRIRNEGVGLKDVGRLPEADLVLLLNVLQHAGQDFDQDLVPNVDAWRGYAVRYLESLRARASTVFFQLGYTWLGHGPRICEDEEIVDFTHRLIEDAGWRVAACGVIRELNERPRYELVKERSAAQAMILPRLRKNWGSRMRQLISPDRENRRRNLHRFAQRPLWLIRHGV